jgi:hypothetical protein
LHLLRLEASFPHDAPGVVKLGSQSLETAVEDDPIELDENQRVAVERLELGADAMARMAFQPPIGMPEVQHAGNGSRGGQAAAEVTLEVGAGRVRDRQRAIDPEFPEGVVGRRVRSLYASTAVGEDSRAR